MEIDIEEKFKITINLRAEVEICISTFMQTLHVTAPPAKQSWKNATPFAKLLIKVKN